MPRLGRRPNPSSSRAKTPGTLRSASLTENTCDSSSSDWSRTMPDPGIVSRLERLPMTTITGSSSASVAGGLSSVWATVGARSIEIVAATDLAGAAAKAAS